MAAKNKDPQIIDGFSSVQAVKRSGKGHAPKTRPSATRLPDQQPKAKARSTTGEARIGQTAVPVTHELVCYKCDYAFRVRGRIHYTFCPKCKQELDMSDHTIAGVWDLDVKTMGNIIVEKGVTLRGVTLIAQNISVAGDVREATIQVTRRLELLPSGKLDLKSVQMRDFSIGPKAVFSTRRKIECRQLDIAGTLSAIVRAEALVTIRATGSFKGELYSPTLNVEDGAQISAALYLGAGVTGAAAKKDAA
ncbi:MAG: polymer-forming cytoskeletal protein [Verrucomicrobia bacterium]|nr:polymer-forming cytoskeletal protein [Verrucomicrobiota bacterium]